MAAAENDIPDEVWEQWSLECRCCPVCTYVPCPGVQQGAPCDGMCRCEDSHDDDRDDDWER